MIVFLKLRPRSSIERSDKRMIRRKNEVNWNIWKFLVPNHVTMDVCIVELFEMCEIHVDSHECEKTILQNRIDYHRMCAAIIYEQL